jgi:2-haloacid dehalogenase/putative hydrolase of the HAD superfamily
MRYDVITFDCYGTLIDWEAGIAGAFRAAAQAGGAALDRQAVLAAYAHIEPVIQAQEYLPYREVLARTAVAVGARLGWKVPVERRGFLADSLPGWPPFPDTNPALEALAARGYTLGILSNVDDDLLAGTLNHLRVRFDLLITAQQVRSYKPAQGHFVEARRRLAGKRWLHVAQSLFHDVAPAAALGIPVVWVNRKSEPPPAMQPTAEVRDLWQLVEWLERAPSGGQAPAASR